MMKQNNEIVIIPLGTVSPYCKGDKNCPGFLIRCGDKKILLDCGEGISRLLDMSFDLNNLIIILSHLHKGHYSGLGSIGYASYLYKNFGYLHERIKVYIPESDQISITCYETDEDGWGWSKTEKRNLMDFDYLMNFGEEHYLQFIPYNYHKEIEHGNLKVRFKRNPHSLITHSIKIENEHGTIVYSGDTGYSENCLTTFAKNVDLFICEATFLKGQSKVADHHLFAEEAALIAKEAGVQQLMLTHFWPEIDKQKYVEEASKIFPNTIAAEEGKKLILRRKQ